MEMKILIVDDDENSRVFLERALLKQGYRVECVQNGAQALAMADDWAPELIISDILMPELDGFELCRRVKTDARLRGIPFIFYSATFVAAEDRKLAMKLGASRFLVKPMEIDDFVGMIAEVIREYQQRQLPVPDHPLAERSELDRMQLESVARKLEKKVVELYREKEARKKAEQDYHDLKSTLKQLIREAVEQERSKDDELIIRGRQAFMGEMINNIAHQWRQPINTLGLLAQDLQLTHKLGDFNKEFVESNVKKTMEVIRGMSRTIEDFSTFFKSERERIDFRVLKVITKIRSFVEEGFRAKGITIELRSTGDPVARGYPGEFSQVILNVLMNARDALLQENVERPLICIEVFQEGGRIVVQITDNAGGIPPEIIAKVFDPYFTTKGPDRGTGIGLFMSKSIVEKNMAGSLSVSNVDDGARFRIELQSASR